MEFADGQFLADTSRSPGTGQEKCKFAGQCMARRVNDIPHAGMTRIVIETWHPHSDLSEREVSATICLSRVTPPGTRRKRVGVEPTRDRMATPAGFEDRPPHRGTISSFHCTTHRRVALVSRRTWASLTRRVYPTRSKNSSIWIETLRPPPIMSRN